MKIIVNDKELEVSGERVLIEELREAGYSVPSLCYASLMPDGSPAQHQASCMVCMVRNEANDQMLPSCSTYPVEGMRIDTESEDVKALRRMSLELLLSDHRADCEAPCTMVCPAGIDVAKVILHYDRGQMAEAKAVLSAAVENLDELPCATCKGGCEKACRRKTIDSNVTIKNIINKVANVPQQADVSINPSSRGGSEGVVGREAAVSKLGRYSDAEKEWLKEVYSQPSRCLHCACEGQDGCKLRRFASEAGIKSTRYGVSSTQLVKEQQHITGHLYFEPAKCVRCGLCVLNSQDGFTFQHRGFNMQVVIPEESKSHVSEHLAELCPTGALFLKKQ